MIGKRIFVVMVTVGSTTKEVKFRDWAKAQRYAKLWEPYAAVTFRVSLPKREQLPLQGMSQ